MRSFAFLLALFSIPPSFAASKDPIQQQLVDLAAAGNGLIKLDSQTYDLITFPNRNWSAAVQFTALDKKRRCGPCRSEMICTFAESPSLKFRLESSTLRLLP